MNSKVLYIYKHIIMPVLKMIGWSLKELAQSFMQPKRSSAALTYHTLFAIVPVMSLLVAVAKGLGYAQEFKNQVSDFFHGQEMVSSKLLAYTDSYLDNTHLNSWLGASVGLVVLLYSIFSIFQTIDEEFNHQWDEKGRSFLSLLKTFAFVLVLPFVIIVLLAIWWSVSSYFRGGEMFGANTMILTTSIYILFLFVMYKCIPKCIVQWRYALLSSTICGLIFSAMQYFSYTIITMLGSYRNVYGDLASLIIFLLWIYFSWTICLAGAHWTYLLQSAREKRAFSIYKKSSSRYQEFLFYVMIDRICMMHPETLKFSWDEIIHNLGVEFNLSSHIVEDVLQQMENRGIINLSNDEMYVLEQKYKAISTTDLYHVLNTAGDDKSVINEFVALHKNKQYSEIWNLK